MSWVTIIWSMIASACLTLAIIHFLIWCQRRGRWADLLFTLTSTNVAVFAFIELRMMRADTPAQMAITLSWMQVPTWVIVASLVGFVRFHLRAGRLWLAGTIIGLRSLALLLNFLVGQNLNYLQVTSLRHVALLGEPVAIGVGVPNPWMLVGQLSLLLLLIFVADATITVWRRGDRQQAIWTGGSIVIFSLAAILEAVLVFWHLVDWPLTASVFYSGIVVAMAYDKSRDTLRAGQLVEDLHEREQQMTLATEAAKLGVWMRDFATSDIWASASWRVLFGFQAEERLDFDKFLQRIQAEDREMVRQTLAKAAQGDGHYETEYRVLPPGGELRWIASRGRVDFNEAGKPVRLRGISADITPRKRAEEIAQNLSGRLIHAQEAERERLARELHDDLSQSLALLAVELDMFGQQPATNGEVSERMREFSAQVRGLSSGVHRLSHELHPAKLEQLGLVAAVRGFCKEFGAAHQLAVEFAAHDVPRGLPNDIALCLYRIVQEGLQNVVKHSGAASAQVSLRGGKPELCLVIADEGCGFKYPLAAGGHSLGLVSMHERVRMVRGQILVQSSPGEGTRIEVRVAVETSNFNNQVPA